MPSKKRQRQPSPSPSSSHRRADRQPSAHLSPRHLAALLAVGAALIVLAVHWPALSAKAISFDDNQYLTENPLVRNPSASNAWRFLAEMLEPSTVRGYYQPLTMVSLMLDAALGGTPENPRAFHRTSLILHAANTALIVLLLYGLFGRPWTALAVGLLFGLHPLTVEPIPWVGERKTLLTTFFSIACLLLYVRFTRTGRRRYIAASLVAYALALLSKPTSTPLPVLMLLLDYWPLDRLKWRCVWEKLPFLILGGLMAVVTTVSQARTASVASSAGYSWAVIPLTLCHNIVFYLGKVVVPIRLSPHYPYPLPFNLSQPAVIAGLIGTAVLLAALLLSWRKTRAAIVGWLFFFIAIFPTMGVIGFTHSIASDKYAYLPMIGLLLPVACLLAWAWDRLGHTSTATLGRTALVAAIGLLMIAEVCLTRRQHTIWRDTEHHFQYMLSLAPHSRTLQYGLADAIRTRLVSERSTPAQWNEVERYYRLALRPGPDSPFGRSDTLTCSVHNNLGNILAQRGAIDEAIENWAVVLRMSPNDYNAHNNMGIAMSYKGRPDLAVEHYTQALRLRADLPETHNNLGLELARKGRLDEAIDHYQQAVRLRPNFALAWHNLARAYEAVGRLDPAADAYRRLLALRPSDPEIHFRLGQVLERQGNRPAAIDEYRRALSLNPQHEAARKALESATSK